MMRSIAEAVGPCRRAGTAALVLAALAGCGTVAPPRHAPVLGQAIVDATGRVPVPLMPHVAADIAEGDRNRVLNAMRGGKQALDIGAPRQARALLEMAYDRIETLYADSPTAAAARSTFTPESSKDFKGEPYERAMVGYYLGLADLHLGGLDNAQSSFRWGEFQDTLSASERYSSDTGSLMFLAGWVDHCRGRAVAARERYQQASAARPGIVVPDERHNVLAILEAGQAPRKTRSGQHGEALSYETRTSPAAEGQVEFQIGARSVAGFLAEDLHWQASTLGGREVDKILAGKASFKQTAASVAEGGRAMTAVGLDLMRTASASGDARSVNLGSYAAGIGLAMDLFGSLAKQAARPEADIRTWDNLPGALFLATARLEPAELAAAPMVKARGSALLGAPAAEAALTPIPGTACYLARVGGEGAHRDWRPSAPAAWVALDAVEPAAARIAPGQAPAEATSQAKTSRTRASF